MTQPDRRSASSAAIGLVHQPAGRPASDRYWARSLVVRHARDQHLHIVDVLELEDDGQHNGYVLTRLAALTVQTDAAALLTYGLEPALANKLAADLGVRHLPVPHTSRPQGRD